jgi:hypothetical protein
MKKLNLLPVAPICRPGQNHTYNVGRGEMAKIQCEVMGIPNDINFVWKFNTSVSELLDMPSSIVTNDKTRSTIHFKPMTEHVIITTKCHCVDLLLLLPLLLLKLQHQVSSASFFQIILMIITKHFHSFEGENSYRCCTTLFTFHTAAYGF